MPMAYNIEKHNFQGINLKLPARSLLASRHKVIRHHSENINDKG